MGAAAIRVTQGSSPALKGRLEIEALERKDIVRANDLALVPGCRMLAGTASGGEPVTVSGRTTAVLRRQPDDTWRWATDVPFGIG